MPKGRAVATPTRPPKFYIPPRLGTQPTLPHPDATERASAGYDQREITLPGVDDGERAIAYGEQWLSGKVQFVTTSSAELGQSRLLYVLELCAGDCDALLGIYLPDGSRAPIGASNIAPGQLPRIAPFAINVWWYSGTDTGEIDPNVLRHVVTWDEAFEGTCYAVIELIGFTSYWRAQLPNLIFHMRTRKCLDPETGTHVYSTNPFVQWYDFLRWSEGLALPASRINTESFIDAKHIAHPASGPKLFDTNLLLLEATEPNDVIKTFRLMTDSLWLWEANQYRVFVDRPRASVAIYDNRVVIKTNDGGRGDIMTRPNKVTVWYTDIANGRNLVPVSVTSPELDAGLEEEIEETYRLPAIYDVRIAKSRARFILESRRYDMTMSERWTMATADRQIGDRVIRNIPERGLLFDATLISRTKNPDNTFDVVLAEYNAAKFTEEIETAPALVQSQFPNVNAAPDNVAVGTFTITEVFFREQTGTGKTRAKLTWTNPASYFFDRVDVFVSINDGAYQFVDRGTGNSGEVVELLYNGVMELGVPYTFKLISVSSFGATSGGTTKTVTFQGKTTPPKDAVGITARSVAGEILGTLQPSDDVDILGYEVRRIAEADVGRISSPYLSTDPEGVAKQWTAATIIDPFDGHEFRDTAPFTTWRYLVKAYDGIRYSANAKHVVVTNVPPKPLASENGVKLETWSDLEEHGNFARRGTGEASVEHYGDGSQRVLLARQITAQQIQNQIAALGVGKTLADWAALHPEPLCFPVLPNQGGEIFNQAPYFVISGTSQRNFEYRFYGRASERLGIDRPGVTPFARVLRRNLETDAIVTGPVSTNGPTDGNDSVNAWGFQLCTNDPNAQEVVHNVGTPNDALIRYTKERKHVVITGGSIITNGSGQASLGFSPVLPELATPIVTLIEEGSSPTKARLLASNASSFTIETYNTSTGALVPFATVYYSVVDVGLGGTFIVAVG